MGDWYVGEIRLFAMNWNPEYWLLCDGSLQQIQGNQALYSLLGTVYGGNGSTTFALPDLRGRTIMGGSQTDANYQPGKTGGAETAPLTTLQIPAHQHLFQATTAPGTNPYVAAGVSIATIAATPQLTPPPAVFATPSSNTQMIPLNPATIDAAGSAAGHNNMQPSLVMNYCIARAGTYPPRN